MSSSGDTEHPWPSASVDNSRGRRRRNQRAIAAAIVALAVVVSVAITVSWMWPKKSPFDVKMCRVDGCGQLGRKFVSSLADGQDVENEFPYQVVFTDEAGFINCGGSMINDRWILTSAHCLYNGTALRSPDSIKVSVGVQFTLETASSAIGVEDYWLHPKYNKTLSSKNDIALVKTNRSISESSRRPVNPICLPLEEMNSTDVKVAAISGFGSKDEIFPIQNTLRNATVNIMSNELCLGNFTDSYDESSMICAADIKSGQGSCYVDLGGPLVIKNSDGSFVLKGINSFGQGCGHKGAPEVYTKVSAYLEWTCKTIVENGVDHFVVL